MADEKGAGEAPVPARRGVLGFLIRGFLSLWGLGAAGVAASFLRAPSGFGHRRESESLVNCGSFSVLAIGETRFVGHGSDPFFVTRISPTEVQALSAICTHMRCVLRPEPVGGRFLCPCHAGAFDRNGNVLAGPPSRPLSRYPAEVRADQIVVRI